MRYVAFLRAINVGGHTVTMDRLRSLFESLGFGDVASFLASGNVLFDAELDEAELVERIEQRLFGALGYEVPTFLRPAPELVTTAAHEPFPEVVRGDADRVHVVFLRRPPTAAVRRRVLALATDEDRLAVRKRELYWLRRGPFAESTIPDGALAASLGEITVRNQTTVRKIAAKL